jgi:hypothetical protein
MKPNARLGGRARAGCPPRPGLRMATLRCTVLIIACGVAAGCAQDVVVQNPQTGTAEICRESLGGFNPWSQKMGCVADHVAQGWTTSNLQ